MKSALAEAKAAASQPRRPMNIFSSPELIVKLAMDPRGKELLSQPDFMRMLSDVQQDPSRINMYLKDPRMQLASPGGMPSERGRSSRTSCGRASRFAQESISLFAFLLFVCFRLGAGARAGRQVRAARPR